MLKTHTEQIGNWFYTLTFSTLSLIHIQKKVNTPCIWKWVLILQFHIQKNSVFWSIVMENHKFSSSQNNYFPFLVLLEPCSDLFFLSYPFFLSSSNFLYFLPFVLLLPLILLYSPFVFSTLPLLLSYFTLLLFYKFTKLIFLKKSLMIQLIKIYSLWLYFKLFSWL